MLGYSVTIQRAGSVSSRKFNMGKAPYNLRVQLGGSLGVGAMRLIRLNSASKARILIACKKSNIRNPEMT